MHHALAFNTLLSSQETDAYTRTEDYLLSARGAHLLFSTVSAGPISGQIRLSVHLIKILAVPGTYRVILRLSNQPIYSVITPDARDNPIKSALQRSGRVACSQGTLPWGPSA
ncbi:hypothetical protein ACFQE7_00685 [Nonomuraea ferruginea]|uniref:hypothetical protein n=1 Tax=Nonomuraea ferruginea TaxID=46174 RepID=UPI00337C470C